MPTVSGTCPTFERSKSGPHLGFQFLVAERRWVRIQHAPILAGDLVTVPERVRAFPLEQRDQQRVRVLPDFADQFPGGDDRLEDTIDGAPTRLLLELVERVLVGL